MCGAPNGLWDEGHGLPIFRRGTTATHPAIDHQGKPIGVVDIACFPGSSGSPLCIVNEGSYPNKRQTGKDGGVVFGNRLVLLGVLFAGPVHNARGELEIAPLPTAAKVTPIVPQMIHLGYYVKAREILAIIAELERRPVTGTPGSKMRFRDFVICAVDVGSVKQGNFAWASSVRAGDSKMETLIAAITEDFAASRAVALGFESPLWIPIADDPYQLTCAQRGEGNRPWLAGAGRGSALATGLAQSTWVLDRLRRAAPTATAHLDWSSFANAEGPRLLIWEALISGKAKVSITDTMQPLPSRRSCKRSRTRHPRWR